VEIVPELSNANDPPATEANSLIAAFNEWRMADVLHRAGLLTLTKGVSE
jgi:hypothetical protein